MNDFMILTKLCIKFNVSLIILIMILHLYVKITYTLTQHYYFLSNFDYDC